MLDARFMRQRIHARAARRSPRPKWTTRVFEMVGVRFASWGLWRQRHSPRRDHPALADDEKCFCAGHDSPTIRANCCRDSGARVSSPFAFRWGPASESKLR